MKQVLYPFIIICLFLHNNCEAQANGKLDLKISDTNKSALEGIMVQLVKAKDSTMVLYTFTEKEGTAEFANVVYGNYRIYISQVGYDNYFSIPLIIDDAHKQVSFPEIILYSKALKEVTVEGKTPVLQHYADKTVLNVEKSLLSAVGSVYDVLKGSPGVIMDQNDNISMAGKQNVMVMIDGRITPMSGTDLANLLKGMPSESVEKIEFITNPSAKYDANGTAGIINIVLKKNKAMGTDIAFNAGYGQGIYPKSNDGFSLSERTKKFNIFSSYNYAYRGSSNMINFNTDYYNGSHLTSSSYQNEYLRTPSITNMARIGTDFYASDKTTMGFIADGMISQFNVSETTNTWLYDSIGNEKSYSQTSSTTPNTTHNYSGNFNLKHSFDSTGRELLLDLDYANYGSQGYQNVVTNYYDIANVGSAPPSYLYGSLPGNLSIYSFKADYDGQLGKKGSLESGIKSSYVKTNNDITVYDGINDSYPVDTTQTNHFIYSENINAGYFTYSRTLPKADMQIGLRGEQTIAEGDQVTTGETFSHNYLQLFPNISIDDSLAKDDQIGISASRRIDRPTYNQLNPFRIYINPTFYLQGNPYLVPQNAYTLQFTNTYKQGYTLTLSYTHTTNAIETVILPFPQSPNIAEQTEENLSTFNNLTGTLTIVKQPFKWLNVLVNASGYENQYIADLSSTPINSKRFVWDLYDDNNFTITKKISAEATFYYSSGYDLGYLLLESSWWLAPGMKLSVLKGKGSIKVSAHDVFWTDLTKGTTNFTGFSQSIFVRRDTRYVGVAFSYHFGNSKGLQSLNKKGGAEDEKNRANKTA